ncbi:hypothetical protein HBH56_019460 [Parastagonospora nodorum]|uniref:Uncharacterized protein n=1 Tax=Phaeosphaeria nodorum (strain SN15 / ATCC MYA-4574 / FGSC 10173) TaxID=321614 RepID=Q0UYX0_PHANO|nr:hypothetical protein SNOG_03044 [Parastagonospora nodorum SN15]KAH3919843.1 hypothetical protein HBH56_019460 [Parastagonospora nodorum]EAT89775.1 hypothetical protein SNOG_03044 [Parastagonospora nodorum SN15]KAH3937125.1 hypothetical protein HBH54_015030 [Parastagonospora nodorum]KAH3953611.1 hypothetical protein HBH53_027180 [Parastagonospora nodorum]KAH4137103.1 hypothetical protein HBH45_125760 [Parastagonospora nodorum]
MVLLTMTPGIVRALARAEEASPDDFAKLQRPEDPTLADSKPGNPISHSQLIDLSKLLKKLPSDELPSQDEDTQKNKSNDDSITANDPSNTSTDTMSTPITLSSLLAHTKIYTPPPAPAPEKSPQYTALMARLRAAEEARTYEKMLHPPPTRESFTQRFPSAPIFASHSTPAESEEDELTYDEVHRQIILIINILISIVCVACFVWVAARHWSVGKRLGLSLASSLGVAVAEVAVYGGYVRKVKEAKAREKKKPEIKEIVRSWVLDKGEEKESVIDEGVRKRKGKHR